MKNTWFNFLTHFVSLTLLGLSAACGSSTVTSSDAGALSPSVPTLIDPDTGKDTQGELLYSNRASYLLVACSDAVFVYVPPALNDTIYAAADSAYAHRKDPTEVPDLYAVLFNHLHSVPLTNFRYGDAMGGLMPAGSVPGAGSYDLYLTLAQITYSVPNPEIGQGPEVTRSYFMVDRVDNPECAPPATN